MKITRQEFKEFVGMYNEMFHQVVYLSEYINENLLDTITFPVFNWIEEKIGIRNDEWGWSVLDELTVFSHGVLIEWDEDEEGNSFNEVYTKDLDLIYDKYIKEAGNNDD